MWSLSDGELLTCLDTVIRAEQAFPRMESIGPIEPDHQVPLGTRAPRLLDADLDTGVTIMEQQRIADGRLVTIGPPKPPLAVA